MRKVIGIGETILDIIFKDNQPTAAVPGGSVFNGIISLGKVGANVSFISEVGNDRIGEIIKQFMHQSNVDSSYLSVYPDGKSPVSLAFLNSQNDAEYIFFKEYPKQRLDFVMPKIDEDDILIFGSFYALNPVLRDKLTELLGYARRQGALIYYDPNFRSTHKSEAIKLTPVIMENFEYADIVRGSADDFENMYGMRDFERIYKEKVSFYCPNFIYTSGPGIVGLRTRTVSKEYDIPALNVVSTIGAGDNFNAGIIFGLLKYRIRRKDIQELSEREWDMIIDCGKDFSANVCMSFDNSVSKEFAACHLLNT